MKNKCLFLWVCALSAFGLPSLSACNKNVVAKPLDFTLKVETLVLSPGVWVDSTPLFSQDTSEPTLLGENLDSNDIRIRWWLHQTDRFTWTSTNQGMPSPDGPYWVSNLCSKTPGASSGPDWVVGEALVGIQADTQVVEKSGKLEKTAAIQNGKVTEICISSSKPNP